MTFDELNIVRKLKKQIADETKKLQALKIVVGAFPHKYGKQNQGGSSGGVAKSDFESFVVQIADTEKKIENLQAELTDAVPRLTKKIQENFSDSAEQTLLIYRYVACKSFKEISRLMIYTLRHIFRIHERLLKNVT